MNALLEMRRQVATGKTIELVTDAELATNLVFLHRQRHADHLGRRP